MFERDTARQAELFAPIMKAYARGEDVSNEALYEGLSKAHGLPESRWHSRVPIGRSGEMHSPARRKVRWYQQTLKQLGLIERVTGQRGTWRATAKGRKDDELTSAPPKMVMLGFSTALGIALWGDCVDVFTRINEPIHMCLTSPPYPLAQPRAYGNPTQEHYVDFICSMLEPIVKNLVAGGSICLSISNDIFLKGSPARSLYRERLVIALHERLGLWKMDEFIWQDNSKAPGPIAWASKERFQLNTGWEPVYWFCNDPARVRSDNRRVFQPHSEQHLKLIAQGGTTRTGSYGDGANKLKPGAFGNPTAGKIPKNVFQIAHRCPTQAALRKELQTQGLPMHGATMPAKLARFLIEFLTVKGDLVIDTCSGWATTAMEAELTERRWIVTEKMLQYVQGSAYRFRDALGFVPVL